MEITEQIKEKIKSHALSDLKQESCGLIVSGKVIPCVNRASDSDVHFIIAKGDIDKARKEGKIDGVYHSHIPGDYLEDCLSDEDIIIAEYFNIVSVLYSLTKDCFYIYYPTGKPIDYIGRPYIRGVLDEVVLIKDYYKRELNIDLKYNKGIEFVKKNGFIEVSNIQKHDLLLINWSGELNKQKLALYLGDKILVHPDFQPSKITEYNYGLQKWTKNIYRHPKLT